MLADLANHKAHYGSEIPSRLLKSNCNLKPDLLIISPDDKVYLAELTSPMEGRMKEWNRLKTKKYTDHVLPHLKNPGSVYAFEVGARGGVADSFSTFLGLFTIPPWMRKKLIKKVSWIAVSASEKIWYNRNNPNWTPGGPNHVKEEVDQDGTPEDKHKYQIASHVVPIMENCFDQMTFKKYCRSNWSHRLQNELTV